MKSIDDKFIYRKINRDLLTEYGFKNVDTGLKFQQKLDVEGNFSLNVFISDTQKYIEVIDNDFNEEYYPAYVDADNGGFAKQIRTMVDEIVENVLDKCSTFNYFSSEGISDILDYAKERYGDEPEFLWEDDFEGGVLRNKDSGKWYGIIMKVKADRLGFDTDKKIEVINLHALPERVKALVDNVNIFPAYHMNKQHWYTLLGNGALDKAFVRSLVDDSYALSIRTKKRTNK